MEGKAVPSPSGRVPKSKGVGNEMYLAVFSTHPASRKEPLADMLARVYVAFTDAGFVPPALRFTLADAPASAEGAVLTAALNHRSVSSVARVLKRWPALESMARGVSVSTGSNSTRLISNITEAGTIMDVEYEPLIAIARGIPRSFPFHGAHFHVSHPAFSVGPVLPANPGAQALSMLMRAGVDIGAGAAMTQGVSIQDAWWVNGRQRSLTSLRLVEADESARRLPEPSPEVAAVLTACGKARKTVQVPIALEALTAGGTKGGRDRTFRDIVTTYRARIPQLLDGLPNAISHMPPGEEHMASPGPRKPSLVDAFGPLGYDCFGECGTFTLRRRTAGNHVVKLMLDVGTWSNSVTAFMQVQGMQSGGAFKATLSLPVSSDAPRGEVNGVLVTGQFPIGGPERWKRIVENLAVLVAELDRTFVPEIEEAAGPSPAWYHPDGR